MRWCARSKLPPSCRSDSPSCTSTYLIARRSASRSSSAPPSLTPSTKSPSPSPSSSSIRSKPAATKTATDSSIRSSVAAPMMTSVTGFDPFLARFARNEPLEGFEGCFLRKTYATARESQRLFQASRQTFRDAELHDLVDRRLADRLHRAEVSQERALARGSDPLDRIERRRQCLAGPHLAVVGDREAVRLIADPLDEKHPGRAALLDDRLRPAGRKDLLAFFGQGERGNVRVARGFHHLERRAQLALAAVDENEVGPAGEGPVPDDVRLLATLRGLEAL